MQPPVTSPTHYHLCGDNLDKTVRQRYLRSDSHQSSSLHYFHSYAVTDRVICFSLSEKPNLKHLNGIELVSLMLPLLEDDENFAQKLQSSVFKNSA